MVELSAALQRLWQTVRSPEGILDILLVWLLVYAALSLLRGSRMRQVRGLGLGLAMLGALWLLTRPAGGLVKLDTFNWLLTQLAPLALLTGVVVFQPEIRHSFNQLGKLSLFGQGSVAARSAVVHLVNELVEAADDLAVRRIGMLVAIERRDPLAEVVDTGKLLNAEASAELIATIFQTSTPLHDGAVVATGDRLAAAACLLPLTERRDLNSQLGTRHRAAIGLSERCDAVVVVVSEETGTVSLALGGELQRGLRGEQLKARLLELLSMAEQEEPS